MTFVQASSEKSTRPDDTTGFFARYSPTSPPTGLTMYTTFQQQHQPSNPHTGTTLPPIGPPSGTSQFQNPTIVEESRTSRDSPHHVRSQLQKPVTPTTQLQPHFSYTQPTYTDDASTSSVASDTSRTEVSRRSRGQRARVQRVDYQLNDIEVGNQDKYGKTRWRWCGMCKMVLVFGVLFAWLLSIFLVSVFMFRTNNQQSSSQQSSSDDIMIHVRTNDGVDKYMFVERRTVLFEFRVDVPSCDGDTLQYMDAMFCAESVVVPNFPEIAATSISSSSLVCTETHYDRVTNMVVARPIEVPTYILDRISKTINVTNIGNSALYSYVSSMLTPSNQICTPLYYDILADPKSGTAYMTLRMLRVNKIDPVVLSFQGDRGAHISGATLLSNPMCSLTLEISLVTLT